jgi:hypothetical protein
MMIGNVQVIASQMDELSLVLQGFSRAKLARCIVPIRVSMRGWTNRNGKDDADGK